MKFTNLAALGALALSACACASSDMSFSEREEDKVLAKAAEVCSGKTGKQYFDCEDGVRAEIAARSYSQSSGNRSFNLGQGASGEHN